MTNSNIYVGVKKSTLNGSKKNLTQIYKIYVKFKFFIMLF